MIIRSIETFQVAVPLKKAFKTALRTVTVADAIYVRIQTQDGREGFGEAPPTHVITGESLASIRFTIEEVMKPLLIGRDLHYHEQLFQELHRSMVRNTSTKAAVDMALYDLLAQYAGLPLYQYLGGAKSELTTDYTVSVNEPSEMASDAVNYVNDGFQILKVKVGIGEIPDDIKRIKAIREAVGPDIKLRLDANQGWTPKEAVQAIKQMEQEQLNIEFIEQPVLAHDLEGLKFVTNHTLIPIMADESVFSVYDAKRVIEMIAADLINIKLMKAGGIYHALKIATLAASHDMKCMTGSMIETKLGVGAAAHFAASQSNIVYYDFDAPLMLKEDLLDGGIQYIDSKITFNPAPGLGIKRVNKLVQRGTLNDSFK